MDLLCLYLDWSYFCQGIDATCFVCGHSSRPCQRWPECWGSGRLIWFVQEDLSRRLIVLLQSGKLGLKWLWTIESTPACIYYANIWRTYGCCGDSCWCLIIGTSVVRIAFSIGFFTVMIKKVLDVWSCTAVTWRSGEVYITWKGCCVVDFPDVIVCTYVLGIKFLLLCHKPDDNVV